MGSGRVPTASGGAWVSGGVVFSQSVSAASLAQRNSQGRLMIADAIDNNQATTLGQVTTLLENKLEEVTPPNLNITVNNTQVRIPSVTNGVFSSEGLLVAAEATANTVARRSAGGRLVVGNAINSTEAINLGQFTTALTTKADLVDGKIPLSQIPDTILGQVEYQGNWNASTDTPTLPDPTTVKGHYYITIVGGEYEGELYATGDWVISNGVEWGKVDNTDAVMSVNGYLGVVNLNATDVGAVAANTAITGNTFPKITYDSKGLVTGGDILDVTDIPNLTTAKITLGRFILDRFPLGASGTFLKGNGPGNPTYSAITLEDISDYTVPHLTAVW